MSGAITTTMSAHSHLISRANIKPWDSLHPTMTGTGSHKGWSSRYDKNESYVHSCTFARLMDLARLTDIESPTLMFFALKYIFLQLLSFFAFAIALLILPTFSPLGILPPVMSLC